MKESLLRVKQLQSKVYSLELEIEILLGDIAEIQTTIMHLEVKKQTLISNIAFLKQNHIVAIATEYKKSVELLKTTEAYLSTYIKGEHQLSDIFTKKQKEKEQTLTLLKQAQENLEKEKVVVSVDFKNKKSGIKKQ